MTDYSDIPTVTTLHGEAERTQQAIDMLAAGGTMSNFMISPPTMTTGIAAMMPVSISVTEPLSAELITALNGWLVTRQTNILAQLATYDVGPPPPPITTPPSNTAAPVVTQVDPNLVCTTGTWDGQPTSYTYQWTKDGSVLVGSTASTYPIAFADVGATLTCTVSAINAIGTTVGPPSNGVVVTAPPP